MRDVLARRDHGHDIVVVHIGNAGFWFEIGMLDSLGVEKENMGMWVGTTTNTDGLLPDAK